MNALRTGRGWMIFALWLFAWNAAVPIRLMDLFVDPKVPAGYIGRVVAWRFMLDHTIWALATYAMFRLALRVGRDSIQKALIFAGVLAVPVMLLRYWLSVYLEQALDPNARRRIHLLWLTGPAELLPLIAAAALGLLFVYMQRERDNAVMQANLNAELASARLQTLRLQLNPHFLFNALNSIASLVHSDAAKADTAIAALSSFLRASLAVNRGEETTLEHELELLDAYLEIESSRFEWLTVDLDVPDALRSAGVPAFVLQLLVENAIRHGLAPSGVPGCVNISAQRDADRLTLCVSDDGVGFNAHPSDSLGIGLKNVRERLDQLHGSSGVLTLENAIPHGTVATIQIPYRVCNSESTAGVLLK